MEYDVNNTAKAVESKWREFLSKVRAKKIDFHPKEESTVLAQMHLFLSLFRGSKNVQGDKELEILTKEYEDNMRKTSNIIETMERRHTVAKNHLVSGGDEGIRILNNIDSKNIQQGLDKREMLRRKLLAINFSADKTRHYVIDQELLQEAHSLLKQYVNATKNTKLSLKWKLNNCIQNERTLQKNAVKSDLDSFNDSITQNMRDALQSNVSACCTKCKEFMQNINSDVQLISKTMDKVCTAEERPNIRSFLTSGMNTWNQRELDEQNKFLLKVLACL